MEEILKIGFKVQYKKGQVLLHPYDTNIELFVITEGRVNAYSIEESGEKSIQLIYAPGEVFPLSWIIKKRPMAVFYEADTDCEVVRIPADKALRLLETDARTSFALLRQVINQFAVFNSRVDNLGYKFARERVAYRLIVLGRRFGYTHGKTIILPRFSHEDIGSATNVSRESVSREIKRFERLGLIKSEHGNFVILDEIGLRKQIAPLDTPLFIDDL